MGVTAHCPRCGVPAKRVPITTLVGGREVASGDARVAIATLRIATKQAERENADQITNDRIEAAAPNARTETRQKNLESLIDHQRAVYDEIKEYGEISPNDLYSEYHTRLENPKSDRTVRNYRKKIQRYNLVTAEGSTQDRLYRCVESNESP